MRQWKTRRRGTNRQKGTRFKINPKLKKVTAHQLLYGDFDIDAVPNVDDKFPFDPTKSEQVEEIRLSDELKKIHKFAEQFKKDTRAVHHFFSKKGFTTKSRIKSTYSIINKLRRKQLPQLTDVGGIMVLTDSDKETRKVGALIKRKFKVIDVDDFLSNPKDLFYRALKDRFIA